MLSRRIELRTDAGPVDWRHSESSKRLVQLLEASTEDLHLRGTHPLGLLKEMCSWGLLVQTMRVPTPSPMPLQTPKKKHLSRTSPYPYLHCNPDFTYRQSKGMREDSIVRQSSAIDWPGPI
ncbi:hypothetical protein FA15DRAFT_671417 [Coprinopsis marcescibilis]|uniref:Uncharacterized protein n=1 Tax=Coprinopsis marcescibilis TaxID=230819 RepID=A0A5C3KQV4_COPMA|nr:hypothetical protein FA15DRAFT_671417 [Coprinopsis marcescibilis]